MVLSMAFVGKPCRQSLSIKKEAKQLQITNSTHFTKTAQPNCSLTESKENGHPASKHGSCKQGSDIAHTLRSRKEIHSGSSDGGFLRLPASLGLLCPLHNLHLQPNDDATRITSNPRSPYHSPQALSLWGPPSLHACINLRHCP